jgi:thiamine biosynthesis protein ThiS
VVRYSSFNGEIIMKINLNNRDTEIGGVEEINILDLFKHMKFTFPMIVVKINGKTVKKENYATTFIHEGDRVEAIHLIGGG